MSFTHSIMFHHFHNDKHLPAQGSLSSSDFSEMLDWLGKKYYLIGAREYLRRFEKSQLRDNDICLSFDDALLCQYDLAIPILKERGIDAFFFVYSSVFRGEPDNLEVFRYYRTNQFNDIDEFYSQFFTLVEMEFEGELAQHLSQYKKLNYLNAFPFYTENDKWFRYLRDQVLGPAKYEEMMLHLMASTGFTPSEIIKDLWMSEDELKEISKQGHLVGLHSYSHPTQMSKLSYQEQYQQYIKNLEHLNAVVGEVVCMSHPCGDYNDDTLKILDEIGIKIGFRSSLSQTAIKSKFEIPRDDQANIYKAMQL
ncbi:polysaccharide deacetylase family protein [Gammaproteobacteria bacterium]|nr:polysaccharide deacetylase family protein [Gammaproteobacteria bacterium]